MAIFVVVGRFLVRSVAAQGPNHKPKQGAAGIDKPCPPRRMDGEEDNERDQVINEEESSHSAFDLITDAKILLLQMCFGNVVKI